MTKPDLETIIANCFIESDKRQAKYAAEAKKRQAEYAAEAKKRQEEFDARLAKEAAEAKKRQEEFAANQAAYEASRIRADKEMSRLEKLVESMTEQANQETRELKKHIKRVTDQIGGIDRADGKVAENIFYTSLRKRPQLGSIVFDVVWGNTRPQGNAGPEFDIVLINCSSVALVEVKRQARVDDLKKLTTTMVDDFKTCYPHYANHSIYCALATLVSNDNLAHHACKDGVFLITQQGKHIVISDSNVAPIG